MDEQAAARAIEDFLRALGKKPTGDLARTGELVAQAWARELLEGEGQDPLAILRDEAIACSTSSAGLVVLRDLNVTMMCPHHLLPAHGRGDLAYLPGERLAGLGALARALRATTRRLTLQEQATEQMADAIVEALGARGAFCRLRLTHTCMLARGAEQAAAVVETVALRGSFSVEGPARQLALAALGGG